MSLKKACFLRSPLQGYKNVHVSAHHLYAGITYVSVNSVQDKCDVLIIPTEGSLLVVGNCFNIDVSTVIECYRYDTIYIGAGLPLLPSVPPHPIMGPNRKSPQAIPSSVCNYGHASMAIGMSTKMVRVFVDCCSMPCGCTSTLLTTLNQCQRQ